MKATLDRYISSHYEELYRYTRYFCSKYNPKLTIDTVISNAYLHCIEINDNTEDVGNNFAEEARKMHYGESEERNIRGKASFEETQDLLDEGIDVLPLPVPDALKGELQ